MKSGGFLISSWVGLNPPLIIQYSGKRNTRVNTARIADSETQ